MTRVITVTSGKGGVGKTSISLNLAISMALKGFRVAVFDADLGLANINILTGIYPEKHLIDVIEGRCRFEDIIIKDYQGIDIIPGSTGIGKLADLDARHANELIRSFLFLKSYDYIFFDTSAGISAQVISFCMASNEIYLIITGQPTSVTDAYSMLKIFSENQYENPVNVILNQIDSAEEARHIYIRLARTVKNFLSVTIKPAGVIPVDKQVGMAVNAQIPFVMLFPDSNASKCIHTMAKKIVMAHHGKDVSVATFWDRCFSFYHGTESNYNDIEHIPLFHRGPADNGEIEDQNNTADCGGVLASCYSEANGLTSKKLGQKLDEIESGIFDLVRQFNGIKEIIAKSNKDQFVLDFEQWLKDR